jgi:hypothetical protein
MSRFDVGTDTMVERARTRRVRDEVKDGVAVAVASMAASVALVLVATLLMKLAG